MRILPNDTLAEGTPVIVHSRRGIVFGTVKICTPCKDQHGGPINLHTITCTHRRVVTARAVRWRLLPEPKDITPNYSFIAVLKEKPENLE